MTHRAPPLRHTLLGAAALLVCGHATAMALNTGVDDFKVRLDTTVKYSAAARLTDRSTALSTGPGSTNQNDGDNNFGKGLVSNRLDTLAEFDASYRHLALRLSGAAWYDTVYNGDTDNTTATSNHLPARAFSSDTQKLMGRYGELLDAFVSGRFNVAGNPMTVRVGRHTLLWGESLFFGANGIAGGQAPTDLVKVLSVPSSQFKETVRPTGKVSGQWQLNANVALGAYVGYEWEATRLMPVGSYLSTSDLFGPGAERIYAPGPVTKVADIEPQNTGQGGLQLRLRAPSIDTDFGLYAIRFHAMTPSNPYLTAGSASTRLAYHEGIRAFGASAAKSVGSWSFSGEASVRENSPLASVGRFIPGPTVTFDNSGNPGYAVGKSVHVNAGWLASFAPNALSNESSFLGEIAWNKRLSVTKNESMLNPNASVSATSMRLVYSLTYRQVFDGLDFTPSVGGSYTLGKSSAIGPGFGVHRGGDYSIGLTTTYIDRWTLTTAYVGYYGPEGTAADLTNNAQYKQSLRDRNFVSVSLRTAF